MRTLYLLSIIFLMTAVEHFNSAYSKDSVAVCNYSLPSELVLSTKGNSVDAFFFPIGWSRKGLFAFAGISPLEGNDGYSVTYCIYNLATDSCIWKYNDFGEYPEPYTSAIKASWQKQRKRINTTFCGFGIEDRAIGIFSVFPFILADDSIFSYVRFKREVSCAGNPVVESELFVRTVKNGEKRIAHQLYGCDAPGFADRSAGALDSMIVIGALRSPFESRIAVITGVVSALGEQPRPMMYKINGARLSTGFSKK